MSYHLVSSKFNQCIFCITFTFFMVILWGAGFAFDGAAVRVKQQINCTKDFRTFAYYSDIDKENNAGGSIDQAKQRFRLLWRYVKLRDVEALNVFALLHLQGATQTLIKSSKYSIEKQYTIMFLNSYDIDYLNNHDWICNYRGGEIDIRKYKSNNLQIIKSKLLGWHEDILFFAKQKENGIIDFVPCLESLRYRQCYAQLVSEGKMPSLFNYVKHIEKENPWILTN